VPNKKIFAKKLLVWKKYPNFAPIIEKQAKELNSDKRHLSGFFIFLHPKRHLKTRLSKKQSIN